MLRALAAMAPRTTAIKATIHTGPITLTTRSIGDRFSPMVATATPRNCNQKQPMNEPPKTAPKTRPLEGDDRHDYEDDRQQPGADRFKTVDKVIAIDSDQDLHNREDEQRKPER